MEENTNTPVQLEKNGIGTAGFICALIGLCLFWIPIAGPIIGWILGTLGLIFSIIGVVKKNRKKGLAIAGLIISCILIVILIVNAIRIAAAASAAVGALNELSTL
ncbi:MAG: hypothetical protein II757_03295 [Bacteroidales bacterium]|jgi:hypothetical protein|nr:hypothetical protein [Bacteroidales bacterium]